MTARLPRRLREILGADLDDLNEAHLQALVGQTETDDLEVKAAAYGRGDSPKRELCADVTAFANARGGLILIGASESGDVVDAVEPIPAEGEEIWIRQVLASGVVPPLSVASRTIPSDETNGSGYVAISIPASVDAPHAVVVNSDLRYVVRDGPRKRPMREPEVADQHRKRVVAASSREGRIVEVLDSLHAQTESSGSPAWLALASVPDSPGRFSISSSTRDETKDWIGTLPRLLPVPNALSSLSGSYVSTGFRRLVLGDSSMHNQEAPSYAIAELHTDGAVGIAISVGHNYRHPRSTDDEALAIPDIVIPFYIVAQLLVAGRWAERTGASGHANVAALLHVRETTVLTQSRRGFNDRLHGTRAINEDTPVSTHTFGADDLSTPGPGLIASAALVSNEIFNTFGAAQCWQLAPAGEIRQPFIDNDHQRHVADWAERHGVTMSTDASP